MTRFLFKEYSGKYRNTLLDKAQSTSVVAPTWIWL